MTGEKQRRNTSATGAQRTQPYFGSGTLCGFHTYVGADDMWVSYRKAWVRIEITL